MDINERRKKSISNETSELLIEQISNELYNHALYRTFANYFATKGLDSLKDYYIGRAEEEIDHHRWIVDRLNYTDVNFFYPAVKEVKIDIHDEVTPFVKTLDAEIETTEQIFRIVDAARKDNNWETFHWLQNTLVDEQTEEEHISRRYLKIAQQDNVDWLTKGDTILTDYQESQKNE